jgi:hypothetical protein
MDPDDATLRYLDPREPSTRDPPSFTVFLALDEKSYTLS